MPQFNCFLGYRIFYWSSEGKPLEPLHFHISKRPREHSTKVWILSDGSMQLAYLSDDIDRKTLNRILDLMKPYINDYTEEWEDFFDVSATYYDQI